jgi:hypothetical protein
MWFTTVVVGMMVRSDLLGVTSIIRALNLRPKLYDPLRKHFHSSAIKLDQLATLWTRTVQRLFSNPVRFNGRLVLVGDGIKIPKRGKQMPRAPTKRSARSAPHCDSTQLSPCLRYGLSQLHSVPE